MKVSVIIPVYNVERYLARCVDSVLMAVSRMSFEDAVEIICVNDGSTDGCAGILERYRKAFDLGPSTFSVLTKENGGLGSARNAGLDVATGNYVLFVDSDDWIPAHALVAFVFVAKASALPLVVSTSFLKDAAVSVPSLPPRWMVRPTPWIAGRKVQYCAWNKLYRADLFKTRRYPATIYEDLPITTDILCEVGEFAAIDEPLYVYCTNSGATSLVRSSFTARKLNDSIFVVRETLKTARRQVDARMARFALRQAANGHSSTVGQVWKSKDAAIRGAFLSAHDELVRDFPELRGRLSLKARVRLWRMRRA